MSPAKPAPSRNDAVIIAACRTPIGKFMGSLKPLSAPKLGSLAVADAMRRAGLGPGDVDEVIMGCVVAAGLGQNPARQAALGAGIENRVGAMTLNKVCGSGLKAVALASQAVRLGDEEVVIAGGMESMSNAPHILKGVRDGLRMGDAKLIDSVIHDGLWDVYNDYHMGQTAELVAERYNVSRQAQDEWAYNSHRKALAAMDAGKFKAEIVPVTLPGKKKGETVTFDTDESPRRDTTVESLSALRPVFKPNGGTVTAGNAPGLNDGGAAVVVTSRGWAEDHGREILAVVRGHATFGLEPELVMMAPEGATKKLLAKVGWSVNDVDLFEFNEAFSVQQCALAPRLEVPLDKYNVNGGAVALGHPIGASGARILTTLIYALRDRGKSRGVAALCLGGGNAVAMAVEVP